MLSEELEKRMMKIIDKLEKICINKDSPIDIEKYEYRIQKNVKKRLSQATTKVSLFMDQDNIEKASQKTSNNCTNKKQPSISLDTKKLITIGDFQIELEKLIEILEDIFNNKGNKTCLEKYVNNIIIDVEDLNMDKDTKVKKFGETLEKKYHKILLLFQRYIKENRLVNDIIEKEKEKEKIKNNIEIKMPKKNRRRSLFERASNQKTCFPFLSKDNNDKDEKKIIKDYPDFGNTLLNEIRKGIEKKRNSCVEIVNSEKKYDINKKEKNVKENLDSNSSNSSEDDSCEDNNENNNNVYRPGKLRSSLCFDNLFIC